ncbi:hypothetical protein CL176_08265 [Suicoccus acidiformans]|uniref:DUF5068 domain-containing protein n=1 Tax=Suicoccus acidiformans TaxID=2036206 RepID=A0A347WLN6_9LACT|nr:hypothetical protein [Suicoccus acidiformans]AXY25993.1 hypothetical protein CL176_08265 [Suicoccus acidiformans]
MNKTFKMNVLLISLGLCAGCNTVDEQYQRFIQEQAVETVQNKQSSQDEVSSENEAQVDEESVGDPRFIPEFNQVEHAIEATDKYQIKDRVFRLKQPFEQTQGDLTYRIDAMDIYRLETVDEHYASEFNFETEGAGIILMQVNILNLSDESRYIAMNDLRLSYPDAVLRLEPSSQLYPLDTGNLRDIMTYAGGQIEGRSAVEGYIVYGLSEDALDSILAEGDFFLSIPVSQASADEVVGLSQGDNTIELPFYLPTNIENEQLLLDNRRSIQDRVALELWGAKDILATADLSESSTEEQVELTLVKGEIYDLALRPAYEASFRYFPQGQIIVSLVFEVENKSEYPIMPYEGQASLTIQEDLIQSDPQLVIDSGPRVINPGERGKFVKSFALDKLRYQAFWQGEPIGIAVNIPTELAASTNRTASDAEVEESLASAGDKETLVLYYYFEWMPHLDQYITDALEVDKHSSQDDRTSTSHSAKVNVEESLVDETEEEG